MSDPEQCESEFNKLREENQKLRNILVLSKHGGPIPLFVLLDENEALRAGLIQIIDSSDTFNSATLADIARDILGHLPSNAFSQNFTHLDQNNYLEILYNDGEPCDHPGCRAHLTHPCEKCGRIGARGKIYKYAKGF